MVEHEHHPSIQQVEKEYRVFEDQTELHKDAQSRCIYNTKVAEISIC